MAYVYDDASNIIEKYDARPGAKQALNYAYVYDEQHRLVEANRGSGLDTGFTQAVGSQQWVLDHLGNHIDFNRPDRQRPVRRNGGPPDRGQLQVRERD